MLELEQGRQAEKGAEEKCRKVEKETDKNEGKMKKKTMNNVDQKRIIKNGIKLWRVFKKSVNKSMNDNQSIKDLFRIVKKHFIKT